MNKQQLVDLILPRMSTDLKEELDRILPADELLKTSVSSIPLKIFEAGEVLQILFPKRVRVEVTELLSLFDIVANNLSVPELEDALYDCNSRIPVQVLIDTLSKFIQSLKEKRSEDLYFELDEEFIRFFREVEDGHLTPNECRQVMEEYWKRRKKALQKEKREYEQYLKLKEKFENSPSENGELS